MKKNILVEVSSVLLIFLFVYASVSKLLDYDTFELQLKKSPFVTSYAQIIAWALPVFELLISILLILSITRLIGLYISLFLMTFFSAYIYMMLNFSDYIPCSCGGVLSEMTWTQHFVFNLFFVFLSALAIYIKQNIPMKTKYSSHISVK